MKAVRNAIHMSIFGNSMNSDDFAKIVNQNENLTDRATAESTIEELGMTA